MRPPTRTPMTSDPAPQSSPTPSDSQPSGAEWTVRAAIPNASSGRASAIVTPVTAYDAASDVIPDPAWAVNGLRPERATGTTIDADDTDAAASPDNSTPSEIPMTAGRSGHPPTTPSETTETITTDGSAKVSIAAAR